MNEVVVSANTIMAIQKVITGDPLKNQDKSVAPYLKGHEIVSFFASIPGLDVEDVPLGTRWVYAETVLERINGSGVLGKVIESAVHPLRFEGAEKVEDAVSFLNRCLEYDGYMLVRIGRVFKLRPVASEVKVDSPLQGVDELSHDFLVEQLGKCEARLYSEDFDGAITTAKLIVESTLKALDAQLPGEQANAKADLPRLYKVVSHKLNLGPDLHDTESIKQILRGLTSLIHGLAALRNSMGDAHPRSFKPNRRHAQLAVNAAKTISDFLVESYHFQVAKLQAGKDA